MDLNIEVLKKYIITNFEGNISKASLSMGMKKDTLTKLLNGKRKAGLKSLKLILQYCERKNLDKNIFLK